jgi:hypothetical protein
MVEENLSSEESLKEKKYVDKCRYEIQEPKYVRYGIPAYTVPFRAPTR